MDDKDKKQDGWKRPEANKPEVQPVNPIGAHRAKLGDAKPDADQSLKSDVDPAAEQEEKRSLIAQVKNKWVGETRKGAAFGASDPGSEHWWSVSIGFGGGEIKAGKPVFSADNEKPAADPNDPHSKIMSDKELNDALMARPKEELEALRDAPDLVQAPKAAELSESDSSKKILDATRKMADAVKKMSDEPTTREKLSGSNHVQEARQSQGLTSSGVEMKKQQQADEVKADNRTTPKPPSRS